MSRVCLGAVGYLNARPHVFGLERSPRFELRFDLPARCADLLHAGAIDVGLVPSIEYLRRPDQLIVPGVAIASRGPVESVALYTTRPLRDVQSMALDTSSRTSVALARVLCTRQFKIEPRFEPSGPDLGSMLARCDAALVIGDNALFLDHERLTIDSRLSTVGRFSPAELEGRTLTARRVTVEKIDLGETWTRTTGLPFVYAFWAGRPGALGHSDVAALQAARDAGLAHIDDIVRECVSDPGRQAVASKYLRDNIKYGLGPEEQAGLELFFRYAAEAGLVPATQELRFY
jgi:chorismate dehydratase